MHITVHVHAASTIALLGSYALDFWDTCISLRFNRMVSFRLFTVELEMHLGVLEVPKNLRVTFGFSPG